MTKALEDVHELDAFRSHMGEWLDKVVVRDWLIFRFQRDYGIGFGVG